MSLSCHGFNFHLSLFLCTLSLALVSFPSTFLLFCLLDTEPLVAIFTILLGESALSLLLLLHAAASAFCKSYADFCSINRVRICGRTIPKSRINQT